MNTHMLPTLLLFMILIINSRYIARYIVHVRFSLFMYAYRARVFPPVRARPDPNSNDAPTMGAIRFFEF